MGSVARGVLHLVIPAAAQADAPSEALAQAASAAVQGVAGDLCSAGKTVVCISGLSSMVS